MGQAGAYGVIGVIGIVLGLLKEIAKVVVLFQGIRLINLIIKNQGIKCNCQEDKASLDKEDLKESLEDQEQ